MAVYSIRDNTWNVIDRGKGPAILFIHGFPLDARMWEAQVESLSPYFRCIVPDLPGFGETPLGDEAWSLARWAEDLHLLMRQLVDEQPYFVCGLSMGGYVAWQLCSSHRRHMAGLIQCDTRVIADAPEVARGREMMAISIDDAGIEALAEEMLGKLLSGHTREHNPQLVQRVREVLQSASPAAVATAQRAMAVRDDVTALLPSIDIPSLILCGADDAISPPDEMQGIAEAMPNAKFELISSAGHLAPWEQPQEVNQKIVGFLTPHVPADKAN